MKTYRLKIIMSIIALLLAACTMAVTLAYFSSEQAWKDQNVVAGKFEFSVTDSLGDGLVKFDLAFEAPTLINFSKIERVENATTMQEVLYKRRGDDVNFNGMVKAVLFKVKNLCDTDIIFKTDCSFNLSGVNFIKYFIAEVDGDGDADFEAMLRSAANEVDMTDYTAETPAAGNPADIYKQYYDEIIAIRQYNDEVLKRAREYSAANTVIEKRPNDDKVQNPGTFTEKDFVLFFWVDYASLQEYYVNFEYFDENSVYDGLTQAEKYSVLYDRFINSNVLPSFDGNSSLVVSANISLTFTQSNNTDFTVQP